MTASTPRVTRFASPAFHPNVRRSRQVRCHTPRVNEVVPWSSRAAGWLRAAAVGSRSGVKAVRDWLSDLGFGALVLVGGIVLVGALGLSLVMGRSSPSICDQTVGDAHTIGLYNGSRDLPPDATITLHQAGRALVARAEKASGAQHDALMTMSDTAKGARTGQPFHATSALASYHGVCS
jgi:hypothetical protein